MLQVTTDRKRFGHFASVNTSDSSSKNVLTKTSNYLLFFFIFFLLLQRSRIVLRHDITVTVTYLLQDRPQTCSLMVLMKLAVYSRSSLKPQGFSAIVAPWGQCCVRASLYRGQDCRTCSGVSSESDYSFGKLGTSVPFSQITSTLFMHSQLCCGPLRPLHPFVCRTRSGVCGPVSHGLSQTDCVCDS